MGLYRGYWAIHVAHIPYVHTRKSFTIIEKRKTLFFLRNTFSKKKHRKGGSPFYAKDYQKKISKIWHQQQFTPSNIKHNSPLAFTNHPKMLYTRLKETRGKENAQGCNSKTLLRQYNYVPPQFFLFFSSLPPPPWTKSIHFSTY